MANAAETVLVVDDHPDMLDLLELVLRSEGYEVITAPDGIVAVEAVQRHVPNVIVMDLWMPRLDGVRAAEQLRAAGVTTPIIAHTAHPATLGTRLHLFSRVCLKPCSPTQLLSLVADVLKPH